MLKGEKEGPKEKLKRLGKTWMVTQRIDIKYFVKGKSKLSQTNLY